MLKPTPGTCLELRTCCGGGGSPSRRQSHPKSSLVLLFSPSPAPAKPPPLNKLLGTAYEPERRCDRRGGRQHQSCYYLLPRREDRLTPQAHPPQGLNPNSLHPIYFISLLAFNSAQVRGAVGSASALRSSQVPGPVSQGSRPTCRNRCRAEMLELAGRGQAVLAGRGAPCRSQMAHSDGVPSVLPPVLVVTSRGSHQSLEALPFP